jgi:predicted DNA-binding transcriptional regulator YafY
MMAVFHPESRATMGLSEEIGSNRARPMRLAMIYLTLAGGGKWTALALAEATGAGERTIYRDMERLRSAGLAVTGAPKLGYTLEAVPELTPLFLTRAERTALLGVAPAALKARLRAL